MHMYLFMSHYTKNQFRWYYLIILKEIKSFSKVVRVVYDKLIEIHNDLILNFDDSIPELDQSVFDTQYALGIQYWDTLRLGFSHWEDENRVVKSRQIIWYEVPG